MPVRLIRDGILTSRRVDAVAGDPGVEVTYRRLLNVVDDYGCYFADPILVRSAAYPLRTDKIAGEEILRHLLVLRDEGLINLYTSQGAPYLEIIDFRQQRRAKTRKYPIPPASVLIDQKPSKVLPFPNDPRPEDGALPLDEFIEERWARHPAAKRRDRGLAEMVIAEIPGIVTLAVQAAYRNGHESHIASEDWQWRDGVKAQTLADFSRDGNWKYPAPKPPASEQVGMSAAEAVLAEGRRYK